MIGLTFIITDDHIGGCEIVVTPENRARFPVRFQLLDDDGILYFTGYAAENDDDDLPLLDAMDWGEVYAGCTQLLLDGKEARV